jgi:cell division protein FtsZ
MGINIELPKLTELKPRIVVIGVGGAGGNAINNMIASGLDGVEYIAANTDAQALLGSSAERRIQLGVNLTEGLGAGSKPEIGEAAAEEAIDEIKGQIVGAHMVFIAAGMGGGTGTGAAAVIARAAREMGTLTVGIVTKPFQFEGTRRLRTAEAGIAELRKYVDTLIVIPNQNLFRVATDKTTFAEAFVLADQVLYAGVACIVDLIVKDGLINLDFADVRTVMSGMGTAMMGTGEASGELRALRAAEEAISNPLLDEVTLKGAKGVLLSIIGGRDMTLYEVDEAANRVRKEVDPEANIIVGATFDEALDDSIRVAIVASGLVAGVGAQPGQPGAPNQRHFAELAHPRTQNPTSATPPRLPATQPPGAPATPADGYSPVPPPQFVPGEAPAARAPLPPQPAAPDASSRTDAPRELWRAPGNVVIEESRQPRAHAEAPRQPSSAQPAPPIADPFRPAAPEDVRRGNGRRVPGIEEFPAVGQREYQAKAGRYSGPPALPPAPFPQHASPSEPPARSGLLQRMMGSARKADSSVRGEDGSEAPKGGQGITGFFSRNKA